LWQSCYFAANRYNLFSPKDTITALATPYGAGAIALVRISGMQAFEIAGKILASRSGRTVNARNKPANSSFFALLKDGEHLLDEVMVTVFKGPRSFTGEDSVEISCHGSVFIQNQVLQFLIRSGARLAEPGEFTLRAFMNGKMDLSQAEAVADLIASNSEASHKVAINQMRGGFSREIRNLREELIHFASLIELELDFSEEDVEFADRRQLESLVLKIQSVTRKLADSFALGNVIKNGLPVAIVGKPNAGKSTLLNVLLNEERAIVSDIPGTTRDTIEDEIHLGGISFRFIDTAGIRETSDTIESIGVKKTYEKIRQARIVIYLFDVNETGPGELSSIVNVLSEELGSGASLLLAGNKTENKNLRELEAAY
jgi:tRNA modification GTPase